MPSRISSHRVPLRSLHLPDEDLLYLVLKTDHSFRHPAHGIPRSMLQALCWERDRAIERPHDHLDLRVLGRANSVSLHLLPQVQEPMIRMQAYRLPTEISLLPHPHRHCRSSNVIPRQIRILPRWVCPGAHRPTLPSVIPKSMMT